MKSTPNFGIGEIEGPMHYLHGALPALCNRLDFSENDATRFTDGVLASAYACPALLTDKAMLQGQVKSIPAARSFWNLCGDMLLSNDSTLVGVEHLSRAFDHQRGGGNVVLVQNHRAGSDMLVMETLIRRHLGFDACDNWFYMAGHVINLYLIPLLWSAGLNRFQIFSVKYGTSAVDGMTEQSMTRQNIRAMRSLGIHADQGGTLTVYYPEGGRGTGCMKKGEPKTSCIPRNIAGSDKPLLILPTYVQGTENLLPQDRGSHEFNSILNNIKSGTASCIIGEPIAWEALVEANKSHEGDRPVWNQRICDTLLTLVAQLGPEDEAGPYSMEHPEIGQLIKPFQGGVLV
ncbi:MAG: hypothetical protein V4576_04250 [Patescibacteria group bacterium]